MTSSLPRSPSLEQLRRRAKELLRELRAGEPSALVRLVAQHPNPPERPRLADAQLVIAREHGFPSWPRLRAYVERLASRGAGLEHVYRDDLDYHADRVIGLLASAQDGTPSAVALFERSGAPLSEAGARERRRARARLSRLAGVRAPRDRGCAGKAALPARNGVLVGAHA